MSSDHIIEALLIDPLKQCIVQVRVSRVIDARWHMLLDCEHLDMVQARFALYGPHGIWVDDMGFLREPAPYPQFRITGLTEPLAGYGLLTSITEGGRGDIDSVRINPAQLAPMLQFEQWGKRLQAEDYLPQLLRLYLPWP